MDDFEIEEDIEEVVVVLKHIDRFQWFRSVRELWILDINNWHQSWVKAGFKDKISEPDPNARFSIPVVNEVTVDRFLSKMRDFEIRKEDLARDLSARFPGAESWWDVGDLFPIMFIDFDRKHVAAFYPEGTRMERYIPDGWTSEFEDFATKYSEEEFPTREKFWVQDGIDMLYELNERGKKLNQ